MHGLRQPLGPQPPRPRLARRRRRSCSSATAIPAERSSSRSPRARSCATRRARWPSSAQLRRARRAARRRRLRHRLLLAGLPQAPAGRRAEDRPLVRDAHGDRPSDARDRRSRRSTSAATSGCASSPRGSRTRPSSAAWPTSAVTRRRASTSAGRSRPRTSSTGTWAGSARAIVSRRREGRLPAGTGGAGEGVFGRARPVQPPHSRRRPDPGGPRRPDFQSADARAAANGCNPDGARECPKG